MATVHASRGVFNLGASRLIHHSSISASIVSIGGGVSSLKPFHTRLAMWTFFAGADFDTFANGNLSPSSKLARCLNVNDRDNHMEWLVRKSYVSLVLKHWTGVREELDTNVKAKTYST